MNPRVKFNGLAEDPHFEPVFPFSPVQSETDFVGLTKREWFAGMAMQGIIARTPTSQKPEDIMICAYRMADVMMENARTFSSPYPSKI